MQQMESGGKGMAMSRGGDAGAMLGGLETTLRAAKGGPDTWNPAFCGDIDMRIASDGTWFYLGTPIGRKPLVKLFSSVLRREGQAYFLVTPVEKVGIRVDDAPFLAVEMRVEDGAEGPVLAFRTTTDDWTRAGADKPLRFARDERGARRPYVPVRRNLEALISRAVFYDLVERGETRMVDGVEMFGVLSAGAFFPMAPAAELGEVA
jgi:hypothetical protein